MWKPIEQREGGQKVDADPDALKRSLRFNGGKAYFKAANEEQEFVLTVSPGTATKAIDLMEL